MKPSVDREAWWRRAGGEGSPDNHLLVLFDESKAIDLLPYRVTGEEVRIADVGNRLQAVETQVWLWPFPLTFSHVYGNVCDRRRTDA